MAKRAEALAAMHQWVLVVFAQLLLALQMILLSAALRSSTWQIVRHMIKQQQNGSSAMLRVEALIQAAAAAGVLLTI